MKATALICTLGLQLASHALPAGTGDFPQEAVAGAIERAETIVNTRGYGAFLDETFVAEEDIMVQSEEFFPIFYGRAAVTPYFKPPAENLYAHREQYSNVQGMLLRTGLAVVTWHNRYDMHPVGRLPMGGWSRMVAVMREEQDGWNFVALVQAPMSLISQSFRMQEEAVSPDFLDYARRQNPQYDELVASDKRLKARRSGGLPWVTGGGNTQDEMTVGAAERAAAAVADRIPCPPAAPGSETGLAAEVALTLRCGELIYDRNDSDAFFDQLWSREQNVVFMSEQFYNVLYGRRLAEGYFKPPLKNLYAYRERYSNIEAMALAPDLALATYRVRYDMHAITRTPLGGWSRIFAVMKKEDGRWRFQAQFEVPMSLVSQGRWTHEAALAADFPEFARRQNPQYEAQVAKDRKIHARKGEGVPWVTSGENTPQGFKRPEAAPPAP
jgi:hypothetical protein